MSRPIQPISVIVACRNPGPPLQRALASVWSQRETGMELIVIDGASTDGTADWLRGQSHRLAHWASEPDTGVYQAMNRGVAAARGDWILFLGADDILASDSITAEATPALASPPSRLMVGSARYTDGRTYALASPIHPIRRNFVHHQGSFYHRSLFEDGGFDEALRIQADYDFNLRLWCRGVRPEPLALHVATCGTGGLSDAGSWANYREEIAVRHRHFPSVGCLPWDAASLIRFARKQLVRRLQSRG